MELLLLRLTGNRRSKLIGTRQEYPSKAITWAAVERLQPKTKAKPQGDTMAALIARYESERIPARDSTLRVYRSFLRRHILPKWGATLIEDVQPRDVELWLRGLELTPKTRSHLSNLLHVLLEFAMWAGMLPVQQNQMELVVVKGATKPVRKPRSLTVEQFSWLDQVRTQLAVQQRAMRRSDIRTTMIYGDVVDGRIRHRRRYSGLFFQTARKQHVGKPNLLKEWLLR